METKTNLNVYQKLSLVQSELIAPKNQFNKFGNYKYRSCEDILKAIKPLQKKYDFALVICDEVIEIQNRFYIKATACFIDVNDSNNQVKSCALARESETKKGMDPAQITGATSSYARKYALNGLFSIDDTKDHDSMNNSTTGKIAKKETSLKERNKKGMELLKCTEDQKKKLLKKYNEKELFEVLKKVLKENINLESLI